MQASHRIGLLEMHVSDTTLKVSINSWSFQHIFFLLLLEQECLEVTAPLYEQ